MVSSRGFSLVALAALAAGLVGCNTVPQVEYDALQTRYNELNDQNADLNQQLLQSKGHESQLLAELVGAKQRAARAEMAATQLRNRPAPAPAPAPRPATLVYGGGRVGKEISLGSDGLFEAGKATLKSSGRNRLSKLAAMIKRDHRGDTVLVYGHTDSDKIRKSKWKDNLELAAQRAMAVTRELIRRGVSAKDIETIAVGEHRPVTSNSSAAGKAKNRRVVVKIVE